MESARFLGKATWLTLALAASACGDDGSTDDPIDGGERTTDAGADASTDEPAPKLEWTWTDAPGFVCQDDMPSGFFTHEGSQNRLVLYLEGGGACFNEGLCSQNAQSFQESDEPRAQAVRLLNDTANSPFGDYHKVFVGYCSGDVFSGASENNTGFGNRTQQGYLNLGAVLEQIAPLYQDVEHVVFVGSSAGGFGAAFNWERVQKAFGDVPVYLIDDSGPPMRETYVSKCLQEQLRDLWSWDKTLPEGCPECSTETENGGISNIFPYYASAYPERRFALMSSTRDSTIRTFFGFGQNGCDGLPNLPPETFEEGVFDLRDYLAEYDNIAMWITPGTFHTYLIGATFNEENGGVNLADWLGSVVVGGDDFTTVGPQGPMK